MAKKKAAGKKTKRPAKKKAKNSLVGNINKRKQTGTSRPKAESTISDRAYREMKSGWEKK